MAHAPTRKPRTPWTDTVRVMRNFKVRLTQAENAENWREVIATVQDTAMYFELRGLPLPDGWTRFERAREDAVAALHRLKARH